MYYACDPKKPECALWHDENRAAFLLGANPDSLRVLVEKNWVDDCTGYAYKGANFGFIMFGLINGITYAFDADFAPSALNFVFYFLMFPLC